jgi:hypothetical protein
MKRKHFPFPRRGTGALLTLGAWLALLPLAGIAQTNAPARGLRFEDFRIITERNIFNGNRSGQRVTARATAPQRPTRVESFTLVGTLSVDGRETAFFDGSEADFRRAVRKNEKFAGFTLKEIWPAGVQLEEGTNLIALRVGTALRREDEGYWRYAEPGNYGSSAGSWSTTRSRENEREGSRDRGGERGRGGSSRSDSGAGSPPTASASAPNAEAAAEVLRRLMEKREKENQ